MPKKENVASPYAIVW